MRRILLTAIVSGFIGLCACFSDGFGTTLYGTAYLGSSGPATLYTIDSNTGIATPVGLGTGYNRVGAIDFNPFTSTLYGIGTDPMSNMVDLITINTTTGVGMTVGDTGITTPVQDISFRSDGTLFAISQGQAYTINLTTGLATALPNPMGLLITGSGSAFSPSDVLYNINHDTISTINQTTGVGTPTGTSVNYPLDLLNPRTNAMDYDVTSGILYASVVHGGVGGNPFSIDGGPALSTNFIAQIDVSNGNVTGVHPTVDGLDGLALLPPAAPTTSVPDALPTLWLALPLCGLFALARLRPSIKAC